MTTIAFLLYDGMTALDFVGPHEVLARLPGATAVLASPRGGTIRTDLGLLVGPTMAVSEVGVPDVVIVPGGPETLSIEWDRATLDWLRRTASGGGRTCSVCTGAFVLGAAGLLRGRRATTHWALTGALPSFGATVAPDRVCIDGNVITAAGVSAGIDMALVLAAHLTDEATAEALQLCVEYDPQPPFASGGLDTASDATVRTALEILTGTTS
ncbi:MAG TPA: DJ-1/PfpI family protein [Acidimicrobiales bacterium]|jgi:transcriptional regulator GlxA family with amidase domain|nr:DJ-1/PfpI family protein [Acidimicrobiales bacterium]